MVEPNGEVAATVAPVKRVAAEPLRALIADIMRRDGCTQDEAQAVAVHLVDATATGHDSHGVIRTPRYHYWIKQGTLNPNRPLVTLLDAGALLQLDGQKGMGQWLAREATAMGIERARAHGVALVVMRGGGHVGRLGAYAEQACAAGLVSVQFANVAGSRLVAPFGASERALSTAPIAVGVPNGEGDDFVLDFSTAVVAEGKALVAAQGGKPLPPDALVDGEGRRTGDPVALYGASASTGLPNPNDGPGALRAMGEHKGSGLALACELLGGALTGNGAASPTHHPFSNGWFAVFVDPARLDNPIGFAAEVGGFVDYVRHLKPDAQNEKVLIPGDKERATRAARLAEGLPIPAPVLSEILAVADELGLGVGREDLIAR